MKGFFNYRKYLYLQYMEADRQSYTIWVWMWRQKGKEKYQYQLDTNIVYKFQKYILFAIIRELHNYFFLLFSWRLISSTKETTTETSWRVQSNCILLWIFMCIMLCDFFFFFSFLFPFVLLFVETHSIVWISDWQIDLKFSRC